MAEEETAAEGTPKRPTKEERLDAMRRRQEEEREAKEIETQVSEVFPRDGVVLIGGKERSLRPLTFRDIRDIEDEYGSLQKLISAIEEEKFSALLYFVYIMLRHEPEVTLDTVLELVVESGTNIPEIAAIALNHSGLVKRDPNFMRNLVLADLGVPTTSTGDESSAQS